jgi:hypothetical protein
MLADAQIGKPASVMPNATRVQGCISRVGFQPPRALTRDWQMVWLCGEARDAECPQDGEHRVSLFELWLEFFSYWNFLRDINLLFLMENPESATRIITFCTLGRPKDQDIGSTKRMPARRFSHRRAANVAASPVMCLALDGNRRGRATCGTCGIFGLAL